MTISPFNRCSRLAVALVLALVVALQGSSTAAQEGTAGSPEPEIAARAWVLTDARSGEYLAGGNASERLPMASTTKIMAALVAFQEADLDEEATVSPDAAAFAAPAYSNVGLIAGDTLSVRELLMATLISSGDDAAYALAEHLGGGSVGRFVEEMNREAVRLGLSDTHFENPVGFDARGHHSSARDLAEMTRLAMNHPEFREMVGTTYASISTQDREIPLTSTNDLLFVYPPATGVKTGTTPAAGAALVASAASGDESYISVVLDAREDRFAASMRALQYGFAAHDRKDLVVKGERYARADVPYRREETVNLVARESVDGLVDADSNVQRHIRVMDDLPTAAKPGTPLGEAVVEVDGERVGETSLVADESYDEASIGERLWYTASRLWKEE